MMDDEEGLGAAVQGSMGYLGHQSALNAAVPMDPDMLAKHRAEQAQRQVQQEAEHKAYMAEERRQREADRASQRRLAALEAGLRVASDGGHKSVLEAAEAFSEFLKGE